MKFLQQLKVSVLSKVAAGWKGMFLYIQLIGSILVWPFPGDTAHRG